MQHLSKIEPCFRPWGSKTQEIFGSKQLQAKVRAIESWPTNYIPTGISRDQEIHTFLGFHHLTKKNREEKQQLTILGPFFWNCSFPSAIGKRKNSHFGSTSIFQMYVGTPLPRFQLIKGTTFATTFIGLAVSTSEIRKKPPWISEGSWTVSSKKGRISGEITI